jgi:hypothetical protein
MKIAAVFLTLSSACLMGCGGVGAGFNIGSFPAAGTSGGGASTSSVSSSSDKKPPISEDKILLDTNGELFQEKIAIDFINEPLFLNAGPRRLTMWIQSACETLSNETSICMDVTYQELRNPTSANAVTDEVYRQATVYYQNL